MFHAASTWTGGVYSFWRLLLSAAILWQWPGWVGSAYVEAGWDSSAILILALIANLALLLGWRDREAAILMAAGLLWIDAQAHLGWVAPLLLHALTPRSPYGSLSARGRVDPAGDWQFPVAVTGLAWIAMVYVLASGWLPEAWALVEANAVLIPISMAIFWVPWANKLGWVFWGLGAGATTYFVLFAQALDAGWWFVLLLFVDWRWIPASSGAAERLFYDGECGLCHRTVRFLLAEDAQARFRLAPLQGPSFEAAVPEEQRAQLPDSILLQLPSGRLLTRSSAILHAMCGLGGLWRLLAVLIGLVPRRARDAVYDFIARIRKRIFGETKALCPLMPPRLGERFDP